MKIKLSDIKIFFRPIYKPIIDAFSPYAKKSKKYIHKYWKTPWGGSNLPETYFKGENKSRLLHDKVSKHLDSNAKILEIGCNVGRNMNYLFEKGYRNLYGIEISKNAVDLMKKNYAILAQTATIYNKSVEQTIKSFPDSSFDLVYTMATLVHIHPDSEWVFSDIARITKSYLITIEDESTTTWRHFPRKYNEIFERYGLQNIEEFDCTGCDDLNGYIGRVFVKQ